MANNHDLWRMDVCVRAEKALRNVGGWGCLVKKRTLSCKCSFQTSIGNFKLGIFRFTVCTGTFFCSKRFVYKKQHKPWLAKTFQNCLQTVYLQTRAWLTSKSIYMQTRMAQKFAFTVLFTLAILGGFARAAPCRFPRTSHQTPSAPSSQTGCETQLLPAQLQELKQQIRGGLVSIRDELEEVVNGTLKGTAVSVACGIANIFMANLQRYRSHCILISSFFYAGSGVSNWNIYW